MRFLTSALIAEGNADDRFLPFLLGRVLMDVCSTEFMDSVEVGEVTPLRGGARPSTVPEIVDLVRQHTREFHLIFVHRDQDGSTERVHRQWIGPLHDAWPGDWTERLVPVVPVRKTEAWVLADGEALRRTLGVRWSDDDLGVPSVTRDVERIPEPKEPIRRLKRRLGRPVDDYYEELAESISLDRLGEVPSFLAFRGHLIEALRGLGYRSGR